MAKPSNDVAVPRATTRRDLFRLAGLGVGALALPGCFSTGTSPSRTKRKPGEKVELTFWLPGGAGPYLEAHRALAEKYRAQHPDVTVKVSGHTGEQNFLEVLLARVASGNPPSATLLWDTPVSLGVRGSLLPIDDYMESSQNCGLENWPEAVLASCQHEGKTYGLPITAGSYAMFFNQDWFEREGIPTDREAFPKTWSELRELSKQLTRWKGDTIETAGFLPTFDPYTLPIWSALNGGQIYDAANLKYTIDSDQNIEMMEFFVDWIDDEYRGDLQKVNETFQAALGENPPAFQEGRLAMRFEGAWFMGEIYSVEPTFENWEVASAPVGPSGSETTSGYWPNWTAIPTASNAPDEAFAYLDYLAVTGVQELFAEFPDLPTNANVPADIVPSTLVERRGQEFAENATAFFREQLTIATPMWDSPVQSFAIDQLARALERIATKTDRPATALAEAQKACQAELNKVL
ncbi:MAG TPA: sugar ABC transporter substrate-binding protein [Actinopolymorphaceae bacterium]|jgi:ABC-type glycerol-3-phosphate transport system substrate-binding protein